MNARTRRVSRWYRLHGHGSKRLRSCAGAIGAGLVVGAMGALDSACADPQALKMVWMVQVERNAARELCSA